MTERAQALEAAVRALIEPMCERVTDNGIVRQKMLVVAGDDAFDRYRRVVELLAVPPPPPVGSPTTEQDVEAFMWHAGTCDANHDNQPCSCGMARALANLRSRTSATPVEPAGASESPSECPRCGSPSPVMHPLAGRDDSEIRACSHSWYGAPVCPVEPTPSINCPLCDEAVQQVSSATLSLALSQHVLWACRRAPNKVEPTPEPPTESVDEKASKWLKATMLSKGRDEDTLPTAVDRAVRRVLGSCSGESLHRHLVRLVRELAPTGAPAPCVWRDISTTQPAVDDIVLVYEEGHIGKALLDASGRWLDVEAGRDDAWFSVPPSHWMPFPTPPLTVER